MKSTQEEILEHLKLGFSISPAIAAQDYNCYCLAAVIGKIEKKGYEVFRRTIVNTRSKEYSLEPFEENEQDKW